MATVPEAAGRLPSVKARIKSLRAVYEEAQQRIAQELSSAALTPFQKFRLGEHQKQVDSIVAALNAELDEVAAGVIPAAYAGGLSLTRIALDRQDIDLGRLNMGNKLHANAIQAVTDQMSMDLLEANGALADNATRILRQVQATKLEESTVNEAIARGLVEGETLRETSQKLRSEIQKTIAEGAKVEVHCKDGKTRYYDPAYYAELVAQTRTREATTAGNINGALEYGITLFQVSFHEGACDYCVPFQGKVYSLTPNDEGWPVLDERPPYHPWCEHVLVPFVQEAKTPEEVEAFRQMSSDSGLVLASHKDYTDALGKAQSGTAAKIGALVDAIEAPADTAGFGSAVQALREASELLAANADSLPAGTVKALEGKIAKLQETLETAFDNYTQKQWLAQAKADKVKYWAYAKKGDLKALYTSPKPAAVEEAKETLAKKYTEFAVTQKAAKAVKTAAIEKLAAQKAAEELAAATKKVDEAIDVLKGAKAGPDFHAALEAAYKAAGDMPQADLLGAAASKVDEALAAWEASIDALTAKEALALAKENGLKYANYANKDDLLKFLKAKNADLAQAWQDEIADIAKEKMAKAAAAAKAKKAAAKAAAEIAEEAPEAAAAAQTAAAKFAELDAAWASGTPPHTFTFLEKAEGIGGAHPKEFYTDELGRKWLFKPVHTQSSQWRGRSDLSFLARTEEMGYKVQRLVDPDAIEVRYIELNGRPGSIQLWRADEVAETFTRYLDPSDFPEELIPQIQREHVVDWLISNHDGHAEQFLVNRNGHVWGIDKGQAFKYFPSDRLAIDYNPTAYGSEKMLMNALLERAKAGDLSLSTGPVADAVRAIEKLSDDEFLAILRPYADGRFRTQSELQAFYDAAVARKNRLRLDFEELYSSVLGRPVSFADEAKAVAQALDEETRAIVQQARRAAGQGKVIPFDGGDIEDQSLLMYTSWKGDTPRAVFTCKVRPEAEAKFIAAFERQSSRAAALAGDSLSADRFYDDILAAVKTVNHHSTDLAYNAEKVAKAISLRDELETLLREATDPEVKKMAREYLKTIDRVSAIAGEKTGEKLARFERYLRATDEVLGDQGETFFATSRHEVKQILHERGIGRQLISQTDDAGYDQILNWTRGGDQIELKFEGGRIRYISQAESNPWAHRGQLEIILDRELDEGAVEQAFELLKRVDIDARVASPEDRELLYLLRQSYVSKAHTEDGYKQLIAGLDAENASTEKRVKELRAYWSRRMGVDDVTQLPQYNPAGEWELCAEDPTIRAGRWHQYRFDVTDEDVEGLYVYHNTSYGSGNSAADLYKSALPGNQTLTATTDKFRWNLPTGASPDSDMETGGGAYVFARLRELPRGNPRPGEIYWKPRVARRLDAITYASDSYGRTTGNYVTERRVEVSEWLNLARRKGSDETIFKNGLSLIEDVERIGYRTAAERDQIIQAFKDAGYARLPDGRRVEELFK